MATRFLSGIASQIDHVADFPLSGASRPRLGPGLRVVFKGMYAIYYLPGVGEIVIVRVLHGSRDIDAIAGQGGFES